MFGGCVKIKDVKPQPERGQVLNLSHGVSDCEKVRLITAWRESYGGVREGLRHDFGHLRERQVVP